MSSTVIILNIRRYLHMSNSNNFFYICPLYDSCTTRKKFSIVTPINMIHRNGTLKEMTQPTKNKIISVT